MRRAKHIFIFAILAAAFCWLSRNALAPDPYSYDESDYMYAATRGLVANYLDSPSQSIVTFLKTGLRRGGDSSQKASLSETIRSSGDINFYRHWHGAMYSYWLWLLSPWKDGEQTVRALSLLFPLLAALALYGGALWLLPGTVGELAALLAATFFLWGHAVTRATELAPHQMFVLWSIVSLLCVAKMLQTGLRKYWYAALAFAGVGFCTLEVAFVLVFTILVCGHLRRRELHLDWTLARNSLAAFLVPVFVISPPALLKLNFLKAYFFMVYLAVVRKNAWGDVTFSQTWTSRFGAAPLEWIIIVAALALWILRRKQPSFRIALPFFLFGLVMLATMLRVYATSPRYVLPFEPLLLAGAGFVLAAVLAEWKSRAGAIVGALLCCLLLAETWSYLQRHPARVDQRSVALLQTIRERNLSAKSLLVPQEDLPTLHYYFPDARVTAYRDESAIPTELSSASFNAVIYSGDPLRIELRP